MRTKYKPPRLRNLKPDKRKGRKKRYILIPLLLVILLSLGILLKVRWGAWFGNAPEAPYNTPEEITRITLTPGSDFTSERTLSWRSGEHLEASAVYIQEITAGGDTLPGQRIPALGRLVKSRSGKGCFYHVSLDSLHLGARYLYQLQSGERRSPIYSFTMPTERDCDTTRFVYLGDVQDPAGQMSSTFFREIKARLADSIQFLALAGDQIEGPTDQYWQSWYQALQGLNTRIPVIAAPGNHEYLKRGFARELDVRWIPQTNYPLNGPKDFLQRSYYIDFPLMRLIVLDTTDIMWLGAINSHKSWLRHALSSSRQPWQVVLFHHAVDCVREGRKNLIMHHVFKDELLDHGADLVLQGHDHGYARSTTRGQRGDTIAPAFVISSASPKVYRNGFSAVHDRLGSGLQLYQDITVTKSQIHYTSYRFQPDSVSRDSLLDRSKLLYDEFTLSRGKDGVVHVDDKARSLPELFLYENFSTDSKGQKRAAQYAKEVKERRERRKKE